MNILNGRIIIREDEMEKSLKQLKALVNGVLKDLGFNKKCDVDFDSECFNFENGRGRLWNELIIRNGDFTIVFDTETHQPTLIKEENGFHFYYVFEFACCGSTNPKTWTNTGYSPIRDDEETVENMIMRLLF